jgi:hypothetical protein
VPIKPKGSVKVTLTSDATLVDILLGKSGQMRVYHRKVAASKIPRAPRTPSTPSTPRTPRKTKNILWTVEKYKEIYALSEGGMTKQELSEKYGVSTLRIYQVLRKANKIVALE